MNKALYRQAIRLVPKQWVALGDWTGNRPDDGMIRQLEEALAAARARGGVLALTDGGEITSVAFGTVRLREKRPATPDTYFRAASISKFVTAYGVLCLAQNGLVDLERDISEYLGEAVRNPAYPDVPITLMQLMTHRSSIRDGGYYNSHLTGDTALSEVLRAEDSFYPWRPGEKWEYSNLAAGMVGSVIGAAFSDRGEQPFEAVMQDWVFRPLKLEATYLPQRVKGTLADAWRLMPPARTPNYDAEARQHGPLPKPRAGDYLMAHGSLCVTAEGLLKVAHAALRNPWIFEKMSVPLASFGSRDPRLQQGVGCFIYQDEEIGRPLYGHQGLAYGAVQALFFDRTGRGFALLTSAVSEEREGVMTKLNRQLCRIVFGEEP